MFEETAGAIAEAESKTEETRSFIKQVRLSASSSATLPVS